MMFDARTGAQLGMPGADGSLTPSAWEPGSYVEWGGGGCRPAWHGGQPVSTDDGTVRLQSASYTDLITISSRYEAPCLAFAGNELRGTPVADTAAVWQERLTASH